MSRKKAKVSERKLRYRKYLKSEHWKKLRAEVVARDGGKCTECDVRQKLEAHHLVYREPLESCTPVDLVTLCRTHHRLAHGLFVRTEFDQVLEELNRSITEDHYPSDDDLRRLVAVMDHEDCEPRVRGLIRLISRCRIKPRMMDKWSKSTKDVWIRLWPWSFRKLDRLKKEVGIGV